MNLFQRMVTERTREEEEVAAEAAATEEVAEVAVEVVVVVPNRAAAEEVAALDQAVLPTRSINLVIPSDEPYQSMLHEKTRSLLKAETLINYNQNTQSYMN